MLFRLGSILASISALTLVQAKGQIAQVVDSTDFCIFLPPTDSTDRNIADTEWNANAFCMGNTPKATGADQLPSGFITSAHYVATDAYVQITGEIDPSKASLNTTDDGGQYDIRAPVGSSCAGWDYYVNLIEPVNNIYCIRCCNDTTNCNRGISQKGCKHIIPGDYSGPSSGSGSGSNPTTTAAAGTATTAAATSTPVTQSSGSASAGTPTSSNPNGSTSVGGASTTIVSASSSVTPATSSGTSIASSVTIATSSPQSAITGTPADPNRGSPSSKSGSPSDGSVSAQSVDGKNSAGMISPGLLTLAAALISFGWLA
ncbi:hypothetical protein DFQ28_007147 [Apophysomyces sp. BC1034]|nr:hypothetical protein DFQ30_007016 [Apophysomyces sp. BC1015]KAG0176551.1 hypothetical protein DFQ29_005984 [Apophysomyces sp. BC1021]KAG0186918.1 hypothetical protein DFQ28_007147 [Apophysomyces sp. BC1034]